MPGPIDLLERGDGLLLVDVQNDFCPGGALAIAGGDEIVPVLNAWIAGAIRKDIALYVSRDWHPVRHPSFKEEGGKWPVHCLQDSVGACFHTDLRLPGMVVKITKGVRFDRDQESVFDDSGFASLLNRDNVHRLWIGGLAEDVCVLYTVLDACKMGLEVFVIAAATRPITPEGGREALKAMKEAGAVIVSNDSLPGKGEKCPEG